jgi:hypothetical protein
MMALGTAAGSHTSTSVLVMGTRKEEERTPAIGYSDSSTQGSSDDVRVAGEAAVPEGFANERCLWAAKAFFVRRECQ